MVDNILTKDNVNMVDMIDMVLMQKTFGYLYLLLLQETSVGINCNREYPGQRTIFWLGIRPYVTKMIGDDFADSCSNKIPLVLMGRWANPSSVREPKARNLMSLIGIGPSGVRAPAQRSAHYTRHYFALSLLLFYLLWSDLVSDWLMTSKASLLIGCWELTHIGPS